MAVSYPGQATTAPALSSLTAGGDRTCGLDASGAAWCWGNNVDGALGDGTTASRPIAAPVSGGLTFSALRTGPNSVCGSTTSGEIWCWGLNTFGQVGDGTTTSRLVPVRVSLTPVAQSIALDIAGPNLVGLSLTNPLTLTLSAPAGVGGVVVTITSDAAGVVASESTTVTIPAGRTTAQVTLHGVALGTTTVRANASGFTEGTLSVQVSDQIVARASVPLAVGFSHTCLLRSGGAPSCWGDNANGRSGRRHDGAAPGPHACRDGASASWRCPPAGSTPVGSRPLATPTVGGRTSIGTLGNGTTTDSPTPVPVAGGLTFAQTRRQGPHRLRTDVRRGSLLLGLQ